MSADAAPRFTGLPSDIPAIAELIARPQWVAWKYEDRGGPKPTKPPISPKSGFGASHSDPRTWGTYQQALALAARRALPGVGYVISADDDFTGIDLDDCIDDDGNLAAWAAEVVSLAETYCEVSPSGHGLRLIARGKVERSSLAKAAGVEIYRDMRYLTITGNHWPSTPADIRPAPATVAVLQSRIDASKAGPIEPSNGTIVPMASTPLPAKTSGSDFYSNVNTRALECLSLWVPSIFGRAARHQGGTGAYRVSSKDLNRDLEEDLSLAPEGIVDFGIHDMGDARQGKRSAIDVCLEYGNQADAKAAAFWLCERLGVEPKDMGWNVIELEPVDLVEAQRAADRLISQLEWFDDIHPVVQSPYIVKGLMDWGAMSVVYGPSNSGKTFFALDIAFHVAINSTWRGMRVHGGSVLYLAAEGGNGIANRIVALRATTGVCDVPLALRRAGLDLLKPNADTAHVLTLAKETAKRGDLAVIVIDTLSRVIAGGDENAAADMTAFIKNVDRIRAATGAHIMIVHHTGKDAAKGARGHSSLRAATDTEIEIEMDDFGGRCAKVKKQRDYEGGEEFHFALKPVFLGNDQDGDDVSSCIVEVAEKTSEAGGDLPDRHKCIAIIDEIRTAWDDRNPYSMSAQSQRTGRYAPRALGEKFMIPTPAMDYLLRRWTDNAIIKMEVFEARKGRSGLMVIGSIL